MTNLINVSNQNGQLVVTSREVAENFNKRHDNVMRDIQNIIGGLPKIEDTHKLFIESEYQDDQNKQMYKEYLLTRDGFSLLVMGFTGAKALEWKLKYINAFNEMEKQIPQLKLSKELQAIFAIDVKTQEIESRVDKLENTMTIDYSQQEEIRSKAGFKVISVLGGKDSPAYKELNKKAFQLLWRDFKRVLQVNSYRNTAVKEFDKAMNFITTWKPTRELELMIVGANSQIRV